MKKLLIITSILSFATLAQAANIGPAGCGLGNLFFGKNMQILAATTNGSSYNQMFGITSGTLNCGEGDGGSAQLENYVEVNQIALANDMARGNGETVTGISKILGCQNTESATSTLKNNFNVIFPSSDVKAKNVSRQIREVLKNNSVACAHLG